MADKGYIGLGLMTPNKRPAGEKLGRNRQAVNRQINRLRSVVERVIANVKGLACFAFWVQAAVGVLWEGVFGGEGVGVLCGGGDF